MGSSDVKAGLRGCAGKLRHGLCVDGPIESSEKSVIQQSNLIFIFSCTPCSHAPVPVGTKHRPLLGFGLEVPGSSS